jgi:hypothetical protein
MGKECHRWVLSHSMGVTYCHQVSPMVGEWHNVRYGMAHTWHNRKDLTTLVSESVEKAGRGQIYPRRRK